MEPPDSLLFDQDAYTAYDILKEAMKQYCAVYTTYYEDIVQEHQEASTEKLADSVDLFPTDPP